MKRQSHWYQAGRADRVLLIVQPIQQRMKDRLDVTSVEDTLTLGQDSQMEDRNGRATFVTHQILVSHIVRSTNWAYISVHPGYYSHLAPTGHRIDHQDRPELLHGTVDFAVPRDYWAHQPEASLLDAADDGSAANLAAAGDALSSTASDLLGGLQSSLGQTPAGTRGPSPAPGYREKEKERKKEEKRLRKPRPLGRVFVIDVSGPSVHRGIVREVCEGIRRALYGSKPKTEQNGESDANEDVDEDTLGADERIAIVTVAETIGFWNLSVSLALNRQGELTG